MAQKIAYLTIDDAPSEDFTGKIEFLEKQDIPAIFFCSGADLEQHPQPIIDAIRRGFIIGNHGYDHPHFSDLTVPECMVQIEKTDAIIDDLYRQASVRRQHRYFRFPYGDKGGLKWDDVLSGYTAEGQKRKDQIQFFLRQLGYSQPAFEDITYTYYHEFCLLDDIDWHWTYDCMDWSVAAEEPQFGIDSLEAVFARMDEDVPEGGRGLNFPGSSDIVLMHDHARTTPLFEPIVQRLLEKGLSFQLPE
jgi:peptidoglycan/xylan/chitin deacetylase (PgdA/CDA1 family)